MSNVHDNIENFTKVYSARVSLTNKCNCRCTYCFEQQYYANTNPKVISLDNLIAIIDKLYDNAICNNTIPTITFFGGEPLLYYDSLIVPSIDYIRNKYKDKYIIKMNTNGILLNEERIIYLSKNNCNAIISCDGDKDSHDSTRLYANGDGTFDDLYPNMVLINKYYKNATVTMVITKNNVHGLFNAIKIFEECGFTNVNLYTNSYDEEDNGLFDSIREQLYLIKDHIINQFESYELPININPITPYLVRPILLKYLKDTDQWRKIDRCQPEHGCGIGLHNPWFIDTDGNTYTCIHVDLNTEDSNIFYMGNILNDTIDPVKLEKLYELRASEELHSEYFDCNTCPLYGTCRGGCLTSNYKINGSMSSANVVNCKFKREVYKIALEMDKYFTSTKNELFREFIHGESKKGLVHYD